MKNTKSLTAAIIQAAPIFLDLEASLNRAIEFIAKAAKQGAQLIVFGETWLPGYPAWLDYCPGAALWDHPPAKQTFARLRQNSLSLDSNEAHRLLRAAADNEVVIVIGVNERVGRGPGSGTLYNTLLILGSDGTLLNHHRKLVPTYTERLVWGQGDGSGLEAVDTTVGRVGGLICWEHWMPLARHVLHSSGEAIHIAAWPTVHEMHQVACRHYAFEGRCFVLAAGLIMPSDDLPSELCEATGSSESLLLRGGSAIIGPDGRYLVDPVFDEEQIVMADLDLSAIDREVMTLDVSGHYHRPDLFETKFRGKLV